MRPLQVWATRLPFRALLPLVMDAITEGWTRGRRAKPLLPVHWEDYWSEPLTELQTAYQLD